MWKHNSWLFRMVLWVAGVSTLAACEFLHDFNTEPSEPIKAFHAGNGRICKNLTPEYASHRVLACETDKLYELFLADEYVSYNKNAFRDAFRERLHRFLSETKFPLKSLNGAKVDVWLEAPVLNPLTVTWVFLVQSPTGTLVVSLPQSLEQWSIGRAEVSLLGRSDYPSSASRRVGTLVIEPRAHLTEANFRNFLSRRLDPLQASLVTVWPRAIVQTPAFQEAEIAKRLEQDPMAAYYVQSVLPDWVSVVEASRTRVFSFIFAAGAMRSP